jgi:MoaA/NifB/PqqE/SkfB family radical SAM enzyme
LRQAFLDGEQPQTCRKCWNEERAGRTSKRMHTLDRLKHMIADQPWTREARPLMFLDLKLGNICNLKCRICGSWSSSQFATEEYNDAPPEQKRQTFAYRMLKAGAWPRESPAFWQQLDDIVPDVRYIEFTGGEPFLIQEHFDLLNRIVQSGHASHVEIHYNTNGTTFPDSIVDTWQHFRTVEIAFSIDDVGDRFEYQRTNASWAQVQQNLERFRQLRAVNSNIKLQACCTINVFNVLYLPEVAEWLTQQHFDFIYWNMMHDAWYFSISCLPDNVKTKIIEKLKHHDFGDYNQEMLRVCEFMERGASTDGFMTRMKINDLDRKRGQDLNDVAPELAKLLSYEAVYKHLA